MQNPTQAIQAFAENFGIHNPEVFFVPGKINVLGEHVASINEASIEATLNAGIFIAITINNNSETHIINTDLLEQLYMVNAMDATVFNSGWQQLIQQLFTFLQQQQFTVGHVNILFGGNLPNTTAFYYDAALLIGILYVFNQLFNWQLSNHQLAQLATNVANKNVENYYTVTDFLAILHGQENSVIVVNANANTIEAIPIQTDSFELIITNVGLPNSLHNCLWSQRQEELTNALSFFKTIQKRIHNFTQISSKVAEQFMYSMDEDVAKRCLYIAQEIERVHQGIQFCKSNDINGLGKLLFKSHKGLTNLYETSNTHLNYLVTESKLHSNCLGSKQLGKQNYMLSLVQPFCSNIITTNVLTSFKSVYQINAESNIYSLGKGLHQVVHAAEFST